MFSVISCVRASVLTFTFSRILLRQLVKVNILRLVLFDTTYLFNYSIQAAYQYSRFQEQRRVACASLSLLDPSATNEPHSPIYRTREIELMLNPY